MFVKTYRIPWISQSIHLWCNHEQETEEGPVPDQTNTYTWHLVQW